RRRARARRAGELQALRGPRRGPRRRGRGDARGRRRGLVPVRGAGRPDRPERLAEALRRLRHLRRDPAQGRHAELERHRRDQQGSERAHLRVLRPRGRRRPARDRPEADRARPGAQGLVTRPADYPPPFGPRAPIAPPTMRNHGNYVASLSQLGRWLAERAEEAGATILPETAAARLLVTDGRVRGVRTGDKGRGRDGQPLPNFEPGSDVVARVTVLAEGTQGHLTGAAI